jgi:hydroxyethylthiazole kinase-like uncharacterized protein yjeF
LKKIFDDVSSFDRACSDKYAISEDILMENASRGIYDFIRKKFHKNRKILIVCGSGNNGADGIALARLLQENFITYLYMPLGAKSLMSKVQINRAKKLDIKIYKKLKKADVVVDALFGTGVNRVLDDKIIKLLKELNSATGYKIACDIPSGINRDGMIKQIAFRADTTITMGGYKTALFSDDAKDYVGKIRLVSLGLASNKFQGESNKFLLTKKDLRLPNRKKQSVNKGSFGHLSVVCGDKSGASYLCAISGLAFGAGLVSVVGGNNHNYIEIMNSPKIPKNTTSICIGMGLGEDSDDIIKEVSMMNIPCLLDADIFYNNLIKKFIDKKNIILTPHPKEFVSLLGILKLGSFTIKSIQDSRFEMAKLFTDRYPDVVLVLKGANTIIAHNKNLYLNRFGTNMLAKGGSGDVLCGLIGALLAQGYSPLDSAISGSLAHCLSAKMVQKNSYALNPKDIIDKISHLKEVV